ncbi:zinc finger HIT domain-containing protein [Natrialbaceae archaeon A-CW2]|uniref:zinc finger HIT domain-containing protein n=1 Tax=Natronosalvus amylolyticus TaxID=2961994 RepID=UPI0020C97924|nr:zinc finger HIT domain-containing protein [Natronosalvus amylolyticus]
MSITGLCQICESRPAEYQCSNCGTLACTAHFDQSHGLCTTCVKTAKPDSNTDVDIHRL